MVYAMWQILTGNGKKMMPDKIVPEYVRNHVKIALSHPHAQILNISVLKMSLKLQMIAHPMIYAFPLGANVGYFQNF